MKFALGLVRVVCSQSREWNLQALEGNISSTLHFNITYRQSSINVGPSDPLSTATTIMASQMPPGSPSRPPGSHSRHPSGTTIANPQRPSTANTLQASPLSNTSRMAQPQTLSPNYTLLIRLPFPRASFVDPPPVDWDASKDAQIWQAISTGATKDLDWQGLSERFEVDLDFLLKQAAWLYSKHFEGVREGMARLATGSGIGGAQDGKANSPAGGAEGMVREGSRGTCDALCSAIDDVLATDVQAESHKGSTSTSTARKVPPLQFAEDVRPSSSSAATRSPHPGISRTPSTATVTQSRMVGSGGSRRQSQTYAKAPLPGKHHDDSVPIAGHDGASESDSEDDSIRHRQLPRRSPLTKQPVLGTLSSDGDAEDDEDDSSGGFLPFATKEGTDNDPAATLISPPERAQPSATDTLARSRNKGKHPASPPTQQPPSSPSASSTTSSQPHSNGQNTKSARQQAQMATLSPRARAAVSGSEGSPSMGSSFSDLDDLSVTKSALEDALLSHVRRGHGGSVLGMGGFGGGGSRS